MPATNVAMVRFWPNTTYMLVEFVIGFPEGTSVFLPPEKHFGIPIRLSY